MAMLGQAAPATGGRKGRARRPTSPPKPATSTVVSRVSLPALTMAFQLACRTAATSTSAKTGSDIARAGLSWNAVSARRAGQHRLVGCIEGEHVVALCIEA